MMLLFRLIVIAVLILPTTLLGHSACGQEAQSAIATPELVSYPLDIAIAADGTAYVVDLKMHGVWKWKAGELSEFFRGSPKFRTPLNTARSVAIDQDGLLLVADTATREIYRFNTEGKPQPLTGGKIGIPMDLAVTSDGTIYVADLERRALLRIRPGSADVEHVADVNPRGVCVDSQERVWVVSQDEQQLVVVAEDGTITPIVKSRIFNFPHQVAVNANGDAYVTDNYEHTVWKVVAGEAPVKWAEDNAVENPVGITLVDDLPVVVDSRKRQVIKFDDMGKPTVWFSIPAK